MHQGLKDPSQSLYGGLKDLLGGVFQTPVFVLYNQRGFQASVQTPFYAIFQAFLSVMFRPLSVASFSTSNRGTFRGLNTVLK